LALQATDVSMAPSNGFLPTAMRSKFMKESGSDKNYILNMSHGALPSTSPDKTYGYKEEALRTLTISGSAVKGDAVYGGELGSGRDKNYMTERRHSAWSERVGDDAFRARSTQGGRGFARDSQRRDLSVGSEHARSQKSLQIRQLLRENAYASTDLRGDYKGMSLKDVSRLYSSKNCVAEEQHIKNYHYPAYYVPTDKDGSQYVRYFPENEKNKKTFMNIVIA
jgi:hypothetical protein